MNPAVTRRIRSLLRSQWIGALALFLVIAGGGAYAAFDPVGGDGDIDACFEKKSGDLDLRKGKKCGKGEKPVTWSQAGLPSERENRACRARRVTGARRALPTSWRAPRPSRRWQPDRTGLRRHSARPASAPLAGAWGSTGTSARRRSSSPSPRRATERGPKPGMSPLGGSRLSRTTIRPSLRSRSRT